MSIKNTIQNSPLGLRGADLKANHTTQKLQDLLNTPYSLKGKKPAQTYTDVLKSADIDTSFATDNTGENI